MTTKTKRLARNVYSPYDMRRRVYEAKLKSLNQTELPGRFAIPLTFILFLLLLAILSWFAINNLRYLESSFYNAIKIQGKKLSLLNEMVNLLQQRQLSIKAMVILGDPFDETYTQLEKRFDNVRSKFLNLDLTPEERQSMKEVNQLLGEIHLFQIEAINHSLMGHQETAFNTLAKHVTSYEQQLLQHLLELQQRQFHASESAYFSARKTIHTNNKWLIIFGIVSFIISSITAYSVIKKVFHKFRTNAEKLRQTHFTLQSTNERLSVENKARRRAEHEIRRHRDELEMKIQQRTTELRQEILIRRQMDEALSVKNQALLESMEQLKTAQDHLVQTEKMAALGGLVAGIAHEINTPLGIGITSASYINDKINQFQQQFDSGQLSKKNMTKFMHDINEASNIIVSNLQRTAEQVHSFKQVAVDQTSEIKRQFNVHQYLTEILLSLKPKLKQTNHQVYLYCPPEIEMYSLPGAFAQVITNLVMNATIHAFDKNQAGQIVINVHTHDDMIQTECIDNGKGINETDLNKIFEPFFTTNRQGGNSGLGLHLVYNIVTQNLQGTVVCESTPQRGTKFIIETPISIS